MNGDGETFAFLQRELREENKVIGPHGARGIASRGAISRGCAGKPDGTAAFAIAIGCDGELLFTLPGDREGRGDVPFAGGGAPRRVAIESDGVAIVHKPQCVLGVLLRQGKSTGEDPLQESLGIELRGVVPDIE